MLTLADESRRAGRPPAEAKKDRIMGHHDHAHTHLPDRLGRAFLIGIVLNLVFVAVEFGAGLWLDSVALISDAGHNLSDVVSLVLSLIAFRLTGVKPSSKYTYGYKKSTVLVSLLNACILLVAVGVILVESIRKLHDPQPVEGGAIAWVAGVGIVVNAFTAWLFVRDKERDLNVKGAYLHMAADALVSVGVVVSGIAIRFTGWYVIDPIVGIAIALIILLSTSRLLLDSLRLSLDGVPAGIDPDRIARRIGEADPAIAGVHHVHIWAISTTENALTAHIVVRTTKGAEALKQRIKRLLAAEGIGHATLEFELQDSPCGERAAGYPGCDDRREPATDRERKPHNTRNHADI